MHSTTLVPGSKPRPRRRPPAIRGAPPGGRPGGPGGGSSAYSRGSSDIGRPARSYPALDRIDAKLAKHDLGPADPCGKASRHFLGGGGSGHRIVGARVERVRHAAFGGQQQQERRLPAQRPESAPRLRRCPRTGPPPLPRTGRIGDEPQARAPQRLGQGQAGRLCRRHVRSRHRG